MFFESHHSREREHFNITVQASNPGFPLHIHRSFECYAVKNGRATAIINGKKYELSSGEAVLVFPYQRHEYKTEPNTSTWVCIFSPDLVGSFNKGRTGTPISNKFDFSFDEEAIESLMMRKSLCYRICGIFDMNAEYTQAQSEKEDLLSKILHYISKNFKEECTLEDIAKVIGYDYSYISKFFKRMTGMSFKSYINGLRIGEACRMLKETEVPISDIAEACGYTTARSFNREFLTLTSKTPREYRKTTTE